MSRKILIFLILFLALPLCAQQGLRSVRYIYFSDDYNINSNLQNALQDNLLKAKGYSIEHVEKKPTFFNNSSYIINPGQMLTEQLLNNSNFYYKSLAKEDVIITPSSLMMQEPAPDKNITKAILNNESDAATSFVSAAPFTARRGQIVIGEQDYEIISTDRSRLTAEWVPAVLVNYYLNTPRGKSTISVFEKPLGGIGAWYEILQNIRKVSPFKSIIINTGGLQVYEQLAPDATFMADYWRQIGVDVLAISPKDIDFIWALYQQEGHKLPPMLVSNIEPINSETQNLFLKTQIIEVNGIKTGFFAIMDNMALSTAAGRGIPFKSTDMHAAAKAAITKLRTEDKVDFVVLISHLKEETLNRLLSRQYGVDMVISGNRVDSYSLRSLKISLQDWNKEKHFVPAYTAHGNGFILGDTLVNFEEDKTGQYTPVLIEDMPSINLYENNTFSNKFYALNKALFSDLTQAGTTLLPRAKDVYAAAGCGAALTYSPAEVFNMAASIIRDKTKSEVALIKIQNFKDKIFGEVTEQQLKNWISDGPETILKVKIKGEHLKEVLKFADFSAKCTHATKDYEEAFTLAVAGVVKDDDDYKINGLTLSDEEIYFLAFPSSLLSERVVLPSLRKEVLDEKQTAFSLPNIVISFLKDLKLQNQQQMQQMFNDYLQDYYLRKEQNLPAQNNIAMTLDQNMEDIGPLAAQDYFKTYAQEQYANTLINLMERKVEPLGTWRFNLKNLALQFTNTNIKNSQYYTGFSNSRLNSDSQTLIQGKFNFAAEYYRDNIRWDNSILLEYGKITLRPANGPGTSNESVDKILLASEYTYKSTTIKHFLGGFLMGPFVSLGYETEFTTQNGAPRYKVLRGKGGVRLFEGEYLKDLYLALVPELDFTYTPSSTKYAWEFGVKVEQPITDDTKAIYRAMIRDFFVIDTNTKTALSYELELDARLEMEVWKKFRVAPFVNYYQAKAESFNQTGSNLFIGVSLSYSRLFKHIPF